jgi:3'(2'), 5'-bisphosphate nucleotidase
MEESSLEVSVALQALRTASRLCQKIRKDLATGATMQKSDRSPVTIADYGSQAIICKSIREAFPEDGVVAEENSAELRKPAHSKILDQVTGYVRDYFPNTSPDEVCSWIDFGLHSIKNRFWALDPIDGTKGYLRGDQYAIALALIENGVVQLGLMACPNLHVEIDRPRGEKGCLFFALRGEGSFQMGMEGDERRILSVSRTGDPAEASFAESVEPDHADHLVHRSISERLKIPRAPLKVDSQVKYGLVARGEVTFYLRVPSRSEPGYQEWIWDHASGAILAEEAGGKVTDLYDKPLDFSCGTRLERNHGILASNGILHEKILKALEM